MTTTEREVRITSHGGIELRAAPEGSNSIGILAGYAAVFNRYSRNLGGFVEQVDPAAFNKSLSDGVHVMARGNHADSDLLGTSSANTLHLEVDGTGLRYEIDLPNTQAGRDWKVLAQRGDVRWSSFAFRTPEGGDEWGYTDQGFPLRTLLSVQLVDVAPVNSPAYLDTSVAARSLAGLAGAPTKTPEAPAPVKDDPDGQRATHPPLSVRKRLLETLNQ